MTNIPYKFFKVADITNVADSEKVAGAIFFDDATETVHIYGAGNNLKIYGSRKWVWSGLNYSTFVKEVAVGDVIIWSASEHQLVARKDVSLANTAKVMLMANTGFNTLTFTTSNGGNTWSLTSSILEDFSDFIPTSDANVNPTANSIVKRDNKGDVKVRGVVDDTGIMYALPYSSAEVKDNADAILQMEITDLDTIRNNAKTAAAAIQNLEKDIESLNQSVENKADKATTLKGYGIIDDYYTDAEVDILLEEVREDVQKEYLPIKGGTMTGTLNTKSLLPNNTDSEVIGNESKRYLRVEAKEIRANVYGVGGSTVDASSKAMGYGSKVGVATGDESYPYVKHTEYTPLAITHNGNECYGLMFSSGESVEYAYNGVSYSYTPSADGLLFLISDDELLYITNSLYVFCFSKNLPIHILAAKIKENELITDGVRKIVVSGTILNKKIELDSNFRCWMPQKTSSSSYKSGSSIAFGYYSSVLGKQATCFGAYATTGGTNATCFGEHSAALADNALAIGAQSFVTSVYGTAIGIRCLVTQQGIAIGNTNIVKNAFAVAIGVGCISGRNYQVALGAYNEGKASNAFELGWGASSTNRKNLFEVTTTGNVTSTGTNTATKHITSGGTSSQFVKGDGSLDSNNYCKVQTVSLPSASGSITKDVYTAMGVANVVKFIYNNGQYELVMSVKEQISGSIAYSTMFFSAKESMFKSFSVEFAPPSSNSNAVGYQVTLANLAIGAATVSEEV